MEISLTGALGVIGSAVIRCAIAPTGHETPNIDEIAYAVCSQGGWEAIRRAKYQGQRSGVRSPDALALAAKLHVRAA